MVRRGGVLLVAGLAVVLVTAYLVVRGTDAGRLLPGSPDCVVGDVSLSTEEAEAASRTVAAGIRSQRSLDRIVASLGRLPPEDRRPVALALTGRAPASLSCEHVSPSGGSDRLTASGLVPRAAVVRRDVDRAFGRQRVGGFAPGGVSAGHQPGSAHYEGRAVDIFFRPVDAANRTRGWAVAAYLVANAARLDVATVIFDGRIWTARRSFQGWRTYAPDTSGRSAATAAILEHRDHVHVDVP